MIEDINATLKDYHTKWATLVADRSDKAFFESLVPVAIGWKVADVAAFDTAVAALRDHCDFVLHTRLNDRWIAKMVVRKPATDWPIPVIKIMQVRPGSTDALGLDHIDFYANQSPAEIEVALQKEGLKWTHEVNHDGDKYPWASLWFAGTEAKIKHYSVLDIYTDELTTISDRIKQGKW